MKIGDIFKCADGIFPQEALALCQDGKAYIEELDPVDGTRCFQIVGTPEPTLEEERAAKLSELAAAFSAAEADAHLTSSLGIVINAGEKANRDIDGLVKLMEAMPDMKTVDFCCYDNTFHAVTLADLKTMQVEVILSGNALYAQKWAFREAINAATKKEELEAVQIKFVFSDFSAKEEAKAE